MNDSKAYGNRFEINTLPRPPLTTFKLTSQIFMSPPPPYCLAILRLCLIFGQRGQWDRHLLPVYGRNRDIILLQCSIHSGQKSVQFHSLP